MKNILHILFIAVLFALAGCEGKEPAISTSDEAASLELFFSVPEISISTKGIEDPWSDPWADDSDWTMWDIFTDGRALYEVAVMIIEESTGNLVGFRHMKANSDYTDSNNGFWDEVADEVLAKRTVVGKAAKMSFLYDSPQNSRTVEKLRRGRYQVLAVGNFSEVSDKVTGTAAYNGLKGAIGSSLTIDTPFSELMQGIAEEYEGDKNVTGDEGITAFKNSEEFKEIWDFNIVTDANHLCHKQPQPLTAVKYIELDPGMNKISLNLERTYVRVRVEIENNSGTDELTINDFDFCDWFTQRAVYLFNDPKDNSRNYEVRYKDNNGNPGLNTHKKSPVLKVETGWKEPDNAIINFSEPVKIPVGESRVIFDGYIFGSKLGATDPNYVQNDSTYQYHLEVSYEDVKGYPSFKSVSDTKINTIAGLNAHYSSSTTDATKYFLIQNQNSEYRFLYNGVTDLVVSSKDVDLSYINTLFQNQDPGKDAYIWKLERNQETGNENDYYIKTSSTTPYYMGVPNRDANISLLAVKGPYYTFSLPDDSENNIVMKSSQINTSGSYDYINIYGHDQAQVRGWDDDDGGSQFVFYPINAGPGYPYYLSDIALNLIDPVTANVYPAQNIKRNDFINILVSVAYNDVDSHFEISTVTAWNDYDEDRFIEFH